MPTRRGVVKTRSPLLAWIVVCAFGLVGLYLVVIRPFGPHWSLLPGELVDSRFLNYVLEHYFRWISGLDAHYWTAPFFYPYSYTIAFGDNLLGSAPIYALLRCLGLDRESAFQGWHVAGYALTFLAAGYVLRRFRFSPLAAGLAAFFFAFGLPIVAQDIHAQLLYRVGVPLACFYLWEMREAPRLPALVAVLFWLTWQFYLSIYGGIFLLLLMVAIFALAPLSERERLRPQILGFWPRRAHLAWQRASARARVFASAASAILFAALVSLLWPYWRVEGLYGFQREWNVVTSMLPTWKSYLLADRSWIWGSVSRLIPGFFMRHEHQLFPGLAAVILAGIAVTRQMFERNQPRRAVVSVHLWAALSLIAVTLLADGFTVYRVLWALPGLDSIRAVSRIILILMWPLALLVAYGIDSLVAQDVRPRLLNIGLAGILSGLLLVESVYVQHAAYDKMEARNRLATLRVQIPADVPAQPILAVASQPGDLWSATEVDAMLLGQELGWPVLNGYSGNFAPGFGETAACSDIPGRIIRFMEFARISSDGFYLNMINRTVPVGFDDCDRSWWSQRPSISTGSGSLSQEQVEGLHRSEERRVGKEC